MELIDRIFYGAIEEFRENGVKFTMDSLAARLGISKRTLYETVPSKTDVFEMVIDRTFADVKRQQKEIFENSAMSLEDKLKRLFTIVPSYSEVMDYRRVNEIKRVYPQLYKKIHEYLSSDWDRTIALLEEGMNAGVIRRKNIVVLKVLLLEIFERLLDGSFLIQNNISYEMAMKETLSIVFDGILAADNKPGGGQN
jgi:AcrR family transcriptional regulator